MAHHYMFWPFISSHSFLVLCTFSCALLAHSKALIEFMVEECETKTDRHLHRVRHTRENKALPYKAAASQTTNSRSNQYESFSLNCPHVADASNNNVRIEVTWTLNDTIWLKIEDGEKRIFNKLTRFYKRTIAGKTVLRVLLNSGRYFFDYDELTGDFAMEIHPVNVGDDVGVWQCHVTVHQKGNTHTLTSRSRVKTSHGLRSHTSFTEQLPHAIFNPRRTSGHPQSKQRIEVEGRELNKARTKVTSFTRSNQDTVQISREDTIRPHTVVFDRQSPLMQTSHAQASIDYEMSMTDESLYVPRSRARSTHYSIGNAQSYLISLIVLLANILILRLT